MPLVLGRLGCESTSLNAFVDPTRSLETWANHRHRITETGDVVNALHADLGLLMGSHGERFAALDEKGEVVGGDDLLVAFLDLVLEQSGPDSRIAAPFSATSGVDEVCERHGAACIRTKADARSLMEVAAGEPDLAFAGDSDGGFMLPRFIPAFDAMLAVGKLLELLAASGQKLSDVHARLPRYYRARAQVQCPWEHKGTVMRQLHEETRDMRVAHLDGIKIEVGPGWVLVLPDVSGPLFHVRAESREPEAAEGLVAEYSSRIEDIQAGL
jgi:mannose-1-phosphate guanylyltransferase/phosphomannomutase